MGQVATQPVDGTNMASNSEYPSDLDNLNKSDIFNPGSFDITDLSQYTNLFGKDFSSCFPQESKKLVLIFALSNYNIHDVVSRH